MVRLQCCPSDFRVAKSDETLSDKGNPLMSARVLTICVAMISLVCSVGCSGSKLVEVTGKVTYKGKPVSAGTISYIAADKPAAYGELQPDGSYTLHTEKPGDGATPGLYQVIVVAMEDQGGLLPEQRGALPPPTVPHKYTSLATTDLKADVESGKKNVIDFNLEGPLGK